ncbi:MULTISPECIES: hypothetical protein, partial [Spirulina sp. CCY15215]|uniref:hypothetical protein n=1 Tax=Spirulina sp. CCY15215 TaxID=2767591 RepID=UPI0019520DD9
EISSRSGVAPNEPVQKQSISPIPETVITPDSTPINSSDTKQEISSFDTKQETSSRSDVAQNEPVQKQSISPISETVKTPDSPQIESSDAKQEISSFSDVSPSEPVQKQS